MCQLFLRGVIKKFVHWCHEINTYQVMLTNFAGNIKQHLFYQKWKVKVDTLIINHFIIIIHFIWYGQPAQSTMSSVPFHKVIVFPCYSHFGPSKQKSYTNIIDSFIYEYQSWETVEWNWQCFTKRRVKINHVSIICLKSSGFFIFISCSIKVTMVVFADLFE